MDISSMIVAALTSGATAGIAGVAEQSIKDAYTALTSLIRTKYQDKVSLDLLERSPHSVKRQEVVKEDIINCGADKDSEVLMAVTSLLNSLIASQDLAFSSGVSISDVKAFNIRVKDVISEGSGVVIKDASVDGDIEVEGVVSGKGKAKIAEENTNILKDVRADKIEIVGNKNYYGPGFVDKSSAKLRLVRNLLGHTYHVNALALRNNILASGGGDRRAIIWNLLSGEIIFSVEHDSWVGSVSVTEDKLITSTGKGEIGIWKYNEGIQTFVVSAHDRAIRTIVLASSQKTLFSGGEDAKIRMWSFPDLNLLHEFNYHSSEVRRIAIDHAGAVVFSGDSKGNVFLLDTNSQKEKQILNLGGQMIRSLAFSDEHNLLALTVSTGEVIVWDTINEIVKWRVQGHNGHSIGIAFHPEKEIIATGGQDKIIRLWNSENGALIDSIVGHDDIITSLVFSPNGKWLISSSRDKTISIWQVI